MALAQATESGAWLRATSLLGIFVLAKIITLAGRDISFSAWSIPAFFWQDILVALGFGLVDHGMKRRRLSWTLYAVLTLYAALSVPLVRLLSTPMTWTMMRAARGTLADSIRHHLTPGNLSLILLILAVGVLLPRLLKKLSKQRSLLACVSALLVVLLGPIATNRVETGGLHRNVVLTLITSALPRVAAHRADEDWRASPFGNIPATNLSELHGAAAGRNVFLILLESTGAEYLKPYGAASDPMPNLTALANESILVENAYAVYPESVKGLFSVLCSQYPAIDTKAELYEHVPCDSVAQIMQNAGYRTALFHSGRFMYLGMDSLIQGRGFEILEDAGHIGGNHNSSFGVDEPSAVRRILAWIDSLSQGEEFFVTYLPIAGHHPYATPEGGPFPDADDSGRYHNALYYGDAALGELIRGLRQRGLYQNTLFVVMGDHGEAFGQHEGNFGHTLFIYEENIRVPYIVAMPGLLREQIRVKDAVVSLIDTAPTLLDLVGLGIPVSYQGQSLLLGSNPMALFFADYSLGLLGLRDGHWKYIYELESGRSKLFDLFHDPQEKANLASNHPDRVQAYRQHLRRWSAAQKEIVSRPVRRP